MAFVSSPNNQSVGRQALSGVRYAFVIAFSFFAYVLAVYAGYWLYNVWATDQVKFEDWLFGLVMVGLCVSIALVSLISGVIGVVLAKRSAPANSYVLKIVMAIDGLMILAALSRLFV
jgi:hypothetical protein